MFGWWLMTDGLSLVINGFQLFPLSQRHVNIVLTYNSAGADFVVWIRGNNSIVTNISMDKWIPCCRSSCVFPSWLFLRTMRKRHHKWCVPRSTDRIMHTQNKAVICQGEGHKLYENNLSKDPDYVLYIAGAVGKISDWSYQWPISRSIKDNTIEWIW